MDILDSITGTVFPSTCPERAPILSEPGTPAYLNLHQHMRWAADPRCSLPPEIMMSQGLVGPQSFFTPAPFIPHQLCLVLKQLVFWIQYLGILEQWGECNMRKSVFWLCYLKYLLVLQLDIISKIWPVWLLWPYSNHRLKKECIPSFKDIYFTNLKAQAKKKILFDNHHRLFADEHILGLRFKQQVHLNGLSSLPGWKVTKDFVQYLQGVHICQVPSSLDLASLVTFSTEQARSVQQVTLLEKSEWPPEITTSFPNHSDHPLSIHIGITAGDGSSQPAWNTRAALCGRALG